MILFFAPSKARGLRQIKRLRLAQKNKSVMLK